MRRCVQSFDSPFVSASLQLAQISLLLLVRLLQLRQANAVLHFNCVQHVHGHFTVQLQRTEKSHKCYQTPTHFTTSLGDQMTLVFISPAPPSSASSCTSCRGRVFSEDRCGTVFRWPPTKSVCLLQEDSPGPLMSDLDGKKRILKH